MKVVLFLPSVTKCGPTNVVFNLLQGLKKKECKVYLIYIWSGDNPELNFLHEHCQEVYDLGGFSIRALLNCLKFLLKLKPDILHTHCMVPDIFGAMISNFCSFPVVTTLHCNLDEDYRYTYGFLKRIIYGFIHKRALSALDLVVPVSKNAASCLRQSTKYKKIEVIYNGVASYDYNIKRGDRVKLIYVGRLVELKNVEFLVDVFSNNVTLLKMIDLHIVGDGPLYEKLKEQSTNINNVFIHGYKNNPLSLFDYSSILVSASASEGMPMSVIEALSANIPCLLSDIPSHKEIYTTMKLGVQLFQFNENSFISSLHRLIVEMECGDVRSNIKSDFKRNFSIEVMSGKYYSLYNALKRK